MALKDTLVRLKRQQKDAASCEAEWPLIRDEWIEAVNSFIDQFKEFLEPFQADGSLTWRERNVSLTEEDLGTYIVPGATIEAGFVKIEITPVGRIVAGAIGRVDLSRQGHSSAAERILILRFRDENFDQARWMLRVPDGPNSSRLGVQWMPVNYEYLTFDKENTEKAIDFLLGLGHV